MFESMTDTELLSWYLQYGAKRQCGFYNIRKVRNKAREEILARNLVTPQQTEWIHLWKKAV